MRTFAKRNSSKDWARLALKFGLILTAPKVWSAINEQLNDRVDDVRDRVDDVRDRLSRGFDDVSDSATRRFEDAAGRVSAATDALRGRRNWAAPAGVFLLGIGVGAGLGVLFAPATGEETREVLLGKAVQAKNKAVQSVSDATDKVRQSVAFTGTEGD